VPPRLRDRAVAPFVLAREPATRVPGRWTVVVDEHGEPAAVLTPSDDADAPPEVGMVLAGGETPIAAVLPALEPDDVVVLTDAGTVVGVWAGEDLVDAVMLGTPRFTTDVRLPGEVRIPEVRRRCRYADEGTTCQNVLSVPEKPEVMPECGNPHQLTAHRFVW